MTREEHLNWCKRRAMEYVETNDLSQAVTSMLSDLGKHPDTKKSLDWASPLGVGILLMKNKQRVVEFIQGFN